MFVPIINNWRKESLETTLTIVWHMKSIFVFLWSIRELGPQAKVWRNFLRFANYQGERQRENLHDITLWSIMWKQWSYMIPFVSPEVIAE